MAESPLAYTNLSSPQGTCTVGSDGWTPISEDWLVQSVAATAYGEYTITIPENGNDKYWHGEKVKLEVVNQDTDTHYFYVTGVNNTSLYLRGDDDEIVTSILPSYCANVEVSSAAAPVGFPSFFTFTPKATSAGLGAGINPSLSGQGYLYIEGTHVTYQENITIDNIGSSINSWTFKAPVAPSATVTALVGSGRYYANSEYWPLLTFGGDVLAPDPADYSAGLNALQGNPTPWPPLLSATQVLALTFHDFIADDRTSP